MSVAMAGFAREGRLGYASDFLCSARRYWFGIYPRVAIELRHWRLLADRIPDPPLRALAVQALERKRGNVEGAAAFAALVSAGYRTVVVRALVSCQVICDYLDLLCEQPCRDPVANGYRLHEALIVATVPGEPHRDYYAHFRYAEDGGYLRALIDSLRDALAILPSLEAIAEPLAHAAERIARYQSFNHGDADGSFEPFETWAARVALTHEGLQPWESAAAAGSTLAVLAMIAAAADPGLRRSVACEIDGAYYPWIGSLHSLLDSLVDYDEDLLLQGRALVDHYRSAGEAAERMCALASEGLTRALGLPQGRRHALIVAAMASFYLCELGSWESAYARLVAPAVLGVFGGLARPNLAVLGARRTLRRRALRAGRPRALPFAAEPHFSLSAHGLSERRTPHSRASRKSST